MNNDDSVEMSAYQEEYSLLPQNKNIKEQQQNAESSNIVEQTQSTFVSSEEIERLNAQQQQDVNQGRIQVNIAQSISNSSDNYLLIKNLIDFLVAAIYLVQLFFAKQIPFFEMIFIAVYLFNLNKYHCKREISRTTIGILYLWLIIMYFIFGFSYFTKNHKLFFIAYIVQICPELFKISIGCCIVSCTCLCTACCFCFCAFSELKQYINKIFESYKYRKIKQDLCNQQLTNIEDRQCPICLQIGNYMNTQKCNHSFHVQCLSAWLDQHKTCPICRAKLY